MRTVDRWLDDYEIGERRVSTGRTITETDVVMHAGQTGDFFPHHMDAQWCASQPFGQRIAHGTLILSIAVGLTAGDINPQSMSYGYDKIRFIQPVFLGDTISVTTEVTAKSGHRKRPDDVGHLYEQLTATNQHGDVVLVATHIYLINKRQTPSA